MLKGGEGGFLSFAGAAPGGAWEISPEDGNTSFQTFWEIIKFVIPRSGIPVGAVREPPLHNGTKVKFLRLGISVLFAILFLSGNLFAGEKAITIIHTNDLHSHILGFSPNIDYRPDITGGDATQGGWARVATVIKQEKEKRNNPVLVLDGGDFLMGSLFHMIAREEAIELRLMKDMGYDVLTLGNHEFDLKPQGLARIIHSATAKGGAPAIVFSNAIFSKESDRDDALEEVFNKGMVKPYIVLEKGGMKIGIFGLMGKDAAEKAPFASPVKFRDPIEISRDGEGPPGKGKGGHGHLPFPRRVEQR